MTLTFSLFFVISYPDFKLRVFLGGNCENGAHESPDSYAALLMGAPSDSDPDTGKLQTGTEEGTQVNTHTGRVFHIS